MLITDPRAALVVAHDRLRELREETAAERFRRASANHCPLAAYLRRLLTRLDAAQLVQRPV